MKRIRRLHLVVVSGVLASFAGYLCARITLFNPAWQIGMRYPHAKIELGIVNSPDPYFWSSFAALFGIKMTDPDHYLMVTIDRHPKEVKLGPLADADELTVSNSRVTDISAFCKKGSTLSQCVFVNCDFSGLPAAQRTLLEPDLSTELNSFYIPYSKKESAEVKLKP